MHLTQQQQLNHQMCPPPLGPPAAWFINPHPQTSGLAPPPPSGGYHHSGYHQHYYNGSAGSINAPSLHSISSLSPPSNGNQLQQHLHQTSRQSQQTQQHQQYGYSPYHSPIQMQQQQQHQQTHQVQHQQQQTHQVQHQQQQYNNHIHHQQPLAIQQPQSQHVHVHQQQQQQHSPLIQPSPQQQLSPHPRPSPTLLHQHQQPSPNYHQQQHSPLNRHLTSPSLQPSPVLLHSTQQSPISRHQQQTPPHHTPTPTSQHHSQQPRPASVKESSSSSTPSLLASTTHHPSNIFQTEVRILELNRRLQSRPTSCYRSNPLPNHDQYDEFIWWEEFMSDFFKDDATLTLYMQIDEKPVRYVLRGTLIPRFFRSYFDGGVTELSINLRNSKELRGQQVIVLECEHANIITKNILKHPKVNSAPRVVVSTEGQIFIEFASNNQDNLLIKSWKFKINVCREYIDRSITAIGLPNTLLVEPTTFQGLPNSTMFFLKMCSIMEPMQELMSQHKLTNTDPRTCLKTILFERYRFKSDDEVKNITTKRRKRKTTGPTSPKNINQASIKRSKAIASLCNSSLTDNVSSVNTANLPPLNVMLVGEPSSMVSDYRDDNERSITKVDNSKYTSLPDEPARQNSSSNEQLVKKEDSYSERLEQVMEQFEETKETSTNGIKKDEATHLQVETKQQSQKEMISKPSGEDLSTVIEESYSCPEDPVGHVTEEPQEKEDNSLISNDEIHTVNSTATQSDNHYNIMNSIPEDREDTCRSTSCDSVVSKLPPSSNNKNTLTSNGSSNKQNRRRSSERKETLREGLMRTSDFVVALKDLKCENPALWRITTGNNLLQQFEPKIQNGVVLYENTNQYAGWNPEIKKDYVGVDVKLTQHTRNQITVEKLHLNFQTLENANHFYDKHTSTYLQILVSTVLDPTFWETIENEPKHHDYFLSSRRIIEDITRRLKIKLASKLKLTEAFLKNVEKYPNLLIKPADKEEKEQLCRACNTNLSAQVVTFGNRSYDLHSYQPVKVTSELSKTSDDRDSNNNICESCLEIVQLYSDIHHMGWKLYNLAKEKIEPIQAKGKRIHDILDECINDLNWMQSIYDLRDRLWLKVENIQ